MISKLSSLLPYRLDGYSQSECIEINFIEVFSKVSSYEGTSQGDSKPTRHSKALRYIYNSCIFIITVMEPSIALKLLNYSKEGDL
jgi:hypothetical protein